MLHTKLLFSIMGLVMNLSKILKAHLKKKKITSLNCLSCGFDFGSEICFIMGILKAESLIDSIKLTTNQFSIATKKFLQRIIIYHSTITSV